MENLQLPLKSKWFEMTKDLIKKEEYREITPYWAKRLLKFDKKERNTKWWINEFFDTGTPEEIAENLNLFCEPKYFRSNTITLGYPKESDTERNLKLWHIGIEIRTGNPDWGAEPNKLYFVILHGAKIVNP